MALTETLVNSHMTADLLKNYTCTIKPENFLNISLGAAEWRNRENLSLHYMCLWRLNAHRTSMRHG